MSLTVIQILPALNAGGVERGTLEVAQHLVRCGHRAVVLSAGGSMVAELIRSGGEHVPLPIGNKSPFALRLIPELRRIFAAADVVHARSRFPAWLAWLAWRGMSSRRRPGFVTTVHGVYSVNVYSGIMCRGERVIAVSDYIRDYIARNFPRTDPGRIVTIHRGIDPVLYNQRFRPEDRWLDNWRREFPQLQDKHLLTLPGRITRRKGHEDFLKILAELKTRGLPFHGLIVGGPHPRKQAYFQQLRHAAHQRGLAGCLTFAGHRDDLREILSISGVVLSLSEQPEAFGRTVLEALALGTPVIAYDHGGVSEIMRAMLPGGLAPPGDTAGVIDRIETFYHKPPTVPARHPYLLHTMLERTVNVYADLAGKNRRV
jgi:glycosyltransferase involved in cell wall biosynthesis